MEDTEYLLNAVGRTDEKGALPHPIEASPNAYGKMRKELPQNIKSGNPFPKCVLYNARATLNTVSFRY